MLEMDAMIATLEFVARSDWVTILPSVISVNDIGRGELIVSAATGVAGVADSGVGVTNDGASRAPCGSTLAGTGCFGAV